MSGDIQARLAAAKKEAEDIKAEIAAKREAANDTTRTRFLRPSHPRSRPHSPALHVLDARY